MTQPRILVAEDEHIIAFDLCDTVEEAGFTVEGPHTDNSSAMLACQKDRPDLAILDIELTDGKVYALAQKLMDENIPIIFHSGQHSTADVEKRFPGAKALSKPCPPSEMISTVNAALASD